MFVAVKTQYMKKNDEVWTFFAETASDVVLCDFRVSCCCQVKFTLNKQDFLSCFTDSKGHRGTSKLEKFKHKIGVDGSGVH